jgi:hypothetical protein
VCRNTVIQFRNSANTKNNSGSHSKRLIGIFGWSLKVYREQNILSLVDIALEIYQDSDILVPESPKLVKFHKSLISFGDFGTWVVGFYPSNWRRKRHQRERGRMDRPSILAGRLLLFLCHVTLRKTGSHVAEPFEGVVTRRNDGSLLVCACGKPGEPSHQLWRLQIQSFRVSEPTLHSYADQLSKNHIL